MKIRKKEQNIIKTMPQNQQNSLRKNGKKLKSVKLYQEKKKEKLSHQKWLGLKIKERNRRRQEHKDENFSLPPSVMHTPLSTERVQKHKENKKLIVDINFKSSHERRSKYLSKKLTDAVETTSPKSKANSISKMVTSQSPKTKYVIMSNL